MSDRRLELDAKLKCPHCGGTPYAVWRRRNVQRDGTPLETYESVLWPSRPNIAPPRAPEKITCPDCHEELRRVAP